MRPRRINEMGGGTGVSIKKSTRGNKKRVYKDAETLATADDISFTCGEGPT